MRRIYLQIRIQERLSIWWTSSKFLLLKKFQKYSAIQTMKWTKSVETMLDSCKKYVESVGKNYSGHMESKFAFLRIWLELQ